MMTFCSRPSLAAFFAVAVLAWTLFGGSRAGAQTPEMTYQVGDRVEIDVQMASNPAYSVYKKGTVTAVDLKDKSYIVRVDPLPGQLPVTYRTPVRAYGAHWIRPISGGAQQPAPQILSAKLRTDQNGTVLANRPLTDCVNFPHDGTNGRPPSAALAAKLIRCLYEKPSPVGMDGATTMDISSLTIGAPHRWVVYEDMGQGTPATLVYPAHVKWTTQTFYRMKNVLTTGREGSFTCFADATNLWQCGGSVGPNRLGSDQEILVTP
jgi:hypothetical protein